ncbi:MAG: PHP domain-containing protein, partial [Candidatus Hodarchaeales archaeon]
SNSGKVSFAVFENDSHRAAFIGTTDPFLELKAWEDDPYLDNHYQFQYNIMNWLGFNPPKELTDYFPIKIDTGIESPHTLNEIKQLPYYQGICHFHTELSNVYAPYNEMLSNFDLLGHQFIVVTDYNTVAGGPALRAYLDSQGRDDISVVDGLELTGISQSHNTGWFKPDNGTLISELANQTERIDMFHEAGSPIFLAHPNWLIDPRYPRIWDHDIYPFDGYEIVNSGFMQGGGNIAMYPFYGAADMSGDPSAMFRVWNYVFTENVSDDPDWWTDALLNRKVVVYVNMGNYFVGDKLLVDEIVGRLNDEHPPEISVTSPISITPDTEVPFTAVITDASRVFSVNLSVKVNGASPIIYTLDASTEDYSSYAKDLGSFDEGDSVIITLTAADELGYTSEKVVEFIVESPTSSETSSQTTTIPKTDGSASWLSLPIFFTGISTLVIIMRKWRIYN